MLQLLLNFLLSLAIGLLIGIERERSHHEVVKQLGVRTFILFALLGTVAALMNQFLLTLAITVFVFLLILSSYFRSTDVARRKEVDIGITTELSGAMVYCMGYLVPTFPLLSIILGAVVLFILLERERLHYFARNKIKPYEIESGILLIIFLLGIVPVLPNHALDPWGLLQLRNIGILLGTIAMIQFAGYIAVHLFGERLGIALTGFLGGLVSSTAVYASFPSMLRSYPDFMPAIISSGIFAVIAMLLEVLVILFVASSTLFLAILLPLGGMIFVGIIVSLMLLRHSRITERFPAEIANPLQIVPLLRITFLIAMTLIFITLAKRMVGSEAMFLISFLGGLFEIHGVSLATALLYLDQHLTLKESRLILSVAISATFISKLFLLWMFSPKSFAWKLSLYLGIMWVTGIFMGYFL